MDRLDGKVALITGGAGGMGESHTRRFVAEGARVVFTDLNEEAGRRIEAELGAAALYLQHDVTREDDWRVVVQRAEAAFGHIHVLVNNAGIVLRGPLENFALADFERVILVNQTAVFLGMKAVVSSMRAAGNGSIINISSITGLVGRPDTIAYTASKFAVRGMTKVAAAEFGKDGIRANSIHPGAIMTPMVAKMDTAVVDSLTANLAIKRLAEAEEVSSLAVYLASDESAYCTGAEFVIDGGLTSI